MRKNGLKNRPLIKTTFSYQPPQTDLSINRVINRPMSRSLSFQDQAVNQDKGTGIRPAKWVFILIFGIWMFFIGVIFGRQTTPVNLDINSIETELARLKDIELLKEQEEIKTGVSSLNEKSLDFYEDLKKGSSRIVAAIPENQNTPEIKRAMSTKKNIEAIAPENIVEPVTESFTDSSNFSEPEPSDQGNEDEMDIGIQVASFVLLKDAETLVAALTKKGYSGTYQTEEEVAGVGTRYRVKVGFFKTRDDAQAVMEDLKNKEKLKDAYIFKKKP